MLYRWPPGDILKLTWSQVLWWLEAAGELAEVETGEGDAG